MTLQLQEAEKPATDTLTVALAGNPNSGKTTLFNALTGARQKVGNYAGVTVEKRSGAFKHGSRNVDLHDLPGTYSLSSNSPEERIAQDELLSGDYDVVVVVVDSSALRRSLGLLAQVMLTGTRCVLVLNMSDEAERSGLKLDVERFAMLLDMPVIQTIGHKGSGVEELKTAIVEAGDQTMPDIARVSLGAQIREALADIVDAMGREGRDSFAGHWYAARLLVGDDVIRERVGASGSVDDVVRIWRDKLEGESGLDISLYVTQCYYGFSHGLVQEVTLQEASPDANRRTYSIDRVLAHRMLGLPIFAAIMYATFWVTFTLGEPMMGWVEIGQGWLADIVSGWWAEGSESVLKSLLVDGLIGGVGGVIIFLPNILLLFACIALLEATGYMARAAFLMDRLMSRFGMHGKSFVPMMTGFGCSIPGILATRTLEDEKDRLTTIMVLPLMSCGARLAIWMLIIPAMFAPEWRAPVLWLIYGSGIAMALLLGWLLRKTMLKGGDSPFVMELPPYRFPTLRAMSMQVFERAGIYLKKAGTVILAFAIILWVLLTFPGKSEFDIDDQVATGEVQVVERIGEDEFAMRLGGFDVRTAQDIENERANEALRYSAAGRVGEAITPVFAPMGMDWKMSTAVIGAFAAKEVFVTHLGIVYSAGEADEESETLRAAVARDYTPLAAIAVMLFLLISTPCMATVAVTKRETGSWGWALLQFFGLTGIGWVVGVAVFQIGLLFM